MRDMLSIYCAVIIWIPLLCHSEFSGFSNGTLTGEWTIKFTIFSTQSINDVIYVADHNRNQLHLFVENTSSSSALLTLLYNQKYNTIKMLMICKCDPCQDIFVEFTITVVRDRIFLKCNNGFSSFSLKKIDVHDPQNVTMDSKVKDLTNVKDRLFINVPASNIGCLHSFYYNNILVSFPATMSHFLSTCPRACPGDNCNGGRCLAMDMSGPICDCSMVARNGYSCKNELRVYGTHFNTSYDIHQDDDNIYFKLSWRRFSDKRYCLLQLVHGNNRDTITVYRSYVSGMGITEDIDGNGINFMTFTLKNAAFQLKVNNKVVKTRRIIFGTTFVNVGFSQFDGECNTFRGSYDFYESGLRLAQPRNIRKDETESGFVVVMDWKFVLVFLFIVLLILSFFSIYFYCRPQKLMEKTFREENTYDVTSSALQSGKKNDSKIVEYEYVEVNLDYITSTKNSVKLQYGAEGEAPELPPRNF